MRNNQKLSHVQLNMVTGPSILQEAFAIKDDPKSDEFFRVKQAWLKQKWAFEAQLKKQNELLKVNRRIFAQVLDRDTPTPRYKSTDIKERAKHRTLAG